MNGFFQFNLKIVSLSEERKQYYVYNPNLVA
jgi:hypothetical protein